MPRSPNGRATRNPRFSEYATGIGLGVGRLIWGQDIARFDTLIPDDRAQLPKTPGSLRQPASIKLDTGSRATELTAVTAGETAQGLTSSNRQSTRRRR